MVLMIMVKMFYGSCTSRPPWSGGKFADGECGDYDDDGDDKENRDDVNDGDDDDDEDEVNDGLSHFLATLVREELTTEICSVHHSSRSISYFALIICTSMITELQNLNIFFIWRKRTPCSFLHPKRSWRHF